MPSVQRAHDDLKDQDVAILAISIDGGGIQVVKRYITKHGFTMSTLVDTEMETARKFGARGVPMTYIIDRQGVVVASSYGAVNFDDPEFREYIQALLVQSRG